MTSPDLQTFYERDGHRQISDTAARLEFYRCDCIVAEVRRLAVRIRHQHANVLDAGAGWGQLSVRLAEEGHHVVSLDCARSRLVRFEDRAKQLGITQVVASLEQTALLDASVDIVVCSEVLEHIPRPDTAVREFSRIMKTPGFLVITVPYAQVLRQALCPHCGATFDPRGHLHSFDIDSATQLLSSSGFVLCHNKVIANRCVAPLLQRRCVTPRVARVLDRLHPRKRNHGWLMLVACKVT
jgi:SAM-dependent methyltransferase